ncbi:hypothetical protein GUJ93_ZPchr0010g9307 [Zizania palustris]|uniref:Uncharacterized protein n=1 Tax=Zizania palustris TaxID=103762 RepID=A0A8J5WDZ0_ZIZPA|nr:hypothetical protein GUJ93_ZPchr0010g9307 [Zizania palustris]
MGGERVAGGEQVAGGALPAAVVTGGVADWVERVADASVAGGGLPASVVSGGGLPASVIAGGGEQLAKDHPAASVAGRVVGFYRFLFSHKTRVGRR